MSVTVFLDSDEITAESFGVSVGHGRQLEGETFPPGGGTIVAHNYQANFNPPFLNQTGNLLQENGDALLQEPIGVQPVGDNILLESGNGTGTGTYGEIKLGRKVTVKDGAVTVFTGFVEDYDLAYDVENRTVATIVVRDALATLGATALREWDTADQLTGARVSALLNRTEVGFPSGVGARDIATGSQPLEGVEPNLEDDATPSYGRIRSGTNALQEFQRIVSAERGRGFVDAAGKLIFQDRYDSFGTSSSATFSDDGANLPFSDIGVRFGTELLHFSVTVKRENPDGVEQVATDSGLIAAYPNLGVRNLAIQGVPLGSDYHAAGLAQFALERSIEFRAVISYLEVPLDRLDTSDRATVCGLEVGDVVTVTWSPYGANGLVTQTLAIEGVQYVSGGQMVRHTASGRATVTFQLSDATDPGYFVVGTDSTDGLALLAP